MLLVGYLYGIKSETRLEEEINYNIAYKWFCGLDLTRQGAGRDDDQPETVAGASGTTTCGRDLQRDSAAVRGEGAGGRSDPVYGFRTHIKAKANKHKKKQVEVAVTPKAYLSELDAQVDQERKELGKKPFDRDDEAHKGGGSATRMQSTTDPESGQQSRDGKPNGFYYSEHRTVEHAI